MVAAEIVETARENTAVACVAAAGLPEELGGIVGDLSNTAFMGAFVGGMYTAVGFLAVSMLLAITLIPRRMRARPTADSADGRDATGEAVSPPQTPVPVGHR